MLIIGAGGAGLRAAIEAASSGVSVGLICKSLLGKAHTVMAEGGMAAAMANNDDRDSWRVHFADTMRGGQYVNNWRMAELHAKEAPDRVRELEGWGAVFDRTPDGRINQRNFGGHRYPRLAHVGDRTGLELIRTLQDHAVYTGMTVHMEHTVIDLILDNGRAAGVLAYDRERGRFHVFNAKAIVLATGGVGRAYKITSNSWEGTGDGHALAYRAGAELIDMEFIQFHPTGMVWPPSVRGILVTEGVRGEGGVLKNSEGRRFMFDDIPDNYKPQTASDPEEGWRYTQGDKSARRPPELLTRDHVARCINREVKAGRGSPHGGVFLDIAWIKEKLKDSEVHIKRKLPSMYHQFKELADLDITKEPMEVGPTTHYVMGGIRVDADTQMSTIPGLFAAGECASGINGANRLGGNSLSDLIVFGKRAGEYAAVWAKEHPAPRVDDGLVERGDERDSLAPFDRGDGGENPYKVQADLQETMQALVGIVRTESEMREALVRIARVQGAGRARGRVRSPRVSRRLAHGARPAQPADGLRSDRALGDRAQGKPRRTLPRGLSGQGRRVQHDQHRRQAGSRRHHGDRPHADPADPGSPQAGDRGAEVVNGQLQSTPKEHIGHDHRNVQDLAHASGEGRHFPDLPHRGHRRHGRPRRRPQDSGGAGAGSGGAVELQSGQVRIVLGRDQRPAPADVHDAAQPGEPARAGHRRADARVPADQGSRDRRVVELPVKKGIAKFKPRKPDAPDGTWRMAQKDIDRVQEFRKCIECFLCQDVCHVLRDHNKHDEFIGPRFLVYAANLEMNPLDTEDRVPALKDEHGIGYCNITKCCTKVCPEHIHITDNAIIPLKERVVDRYFDPITRLLRIFQ